MCKDKIVIEVYTNKENAGMRVSFMCSFSSIKLLYLFSNLQIVACNLYEQRERMKKQLEKTKNQKEKLESLCRSLQAERKQNPAGQSNADSVPVWIWKHCKTCKVSFSDSYPLCLSYFLGFLRWTFM